MTDYFKTFRVKTQFSFGRMLCLEKYTRFIEYLNLVYSQNIHDILFPFYIKKYFIFSYFTLSLRIIFEYNIIRRNLITFDQYIPLHSNAWVKYAGNKHTKFNNLIKLHQTPVSETQVSQMRRWPSRALSTPPNKELPPSLTHNAVEPTKNRENHSIPFHFTAHFRL